MRGPSRPAGHPPSEPNNVVGVHASAAWFYRDQMPGSWVPGYLASRGFSADIQERWHVGYAPAGWDTLTRHLRASGYEDSLIEAAGLARRSRRGILTDTFRDRAIFPIRSAPGTIVAFIGRAAEHADPAVPKYLNSPGTALYEKGQVLFGLSEGYDALAAGAVPVIVEGPLDAIAVSAAGYGQCAAVAPCGTALTAAQVAALDRAAGLRETGVLVAFDADEAGRRAAVNAYHLLVSFTEKMAAVIFLPGSDPAQIVSDRGPAALAAMLTNRVLPLADLVVDAEIDQWTPWLCFAEGQINALRASAPLIAAMPPSDVARQVGRLADRLDLEHAIVTEAVTDALTALIAAGPATTRLGTSVPAMSRRQPTSCQPELPGLPSAAVHVSGQDCPPGTRHALAVRAAMASIPLSGQRKLEEAEQARLRAGRVAG
jgi:DNA primase catalytic core